MHTLLRKTASFLILSGLYIVSTLSVFAGFFHPTVNIAPGISAFGVTRYGWRSVIPVFAGGFVVSLLWQGFREPSASPGHVRGLLMLLSALIQILPLVLASWLQGGLRKRLNICTDRFESVRDVLGFFIAGPVLFTLCLFPILMINNIRTPYYMNPGTWIISVMSTGVCITPFLLLMFRRGRELLKPRNRMPLVLTFIATGITGAVVFGPFSGVIPVGWYNGALMIPTCMMIALLTEPVVNSVMMAEMFFIAVTGSYRGYGVYQGSGIDSAMTRTYLFLFIIGFFFLLLNVLSHNLRLMNEHLEEMVDIRTGHLRRTEHDLELLFNTTLDMLVIGGKDGQTRRISPSGTQILGWQAAEFLEQPLSVWCEEDDRAQFEAFWSHLGEDQAGHSFVGGFRCRDGSVRTLAWSAVGIPERNLIIAAARDITEVQLAQRELLEAKNRAEAADRAKGEFLANISHEIRTPLNAVIGFSEMLSRQTEDTKTRHYLDSIHAAGRALLDLINDILDLSKLEAGKMELRRSPVDIRQLVKDVVRVFSLKAGEKGLQLYVNVAPDVPDTVMVDEARLRQVLLNLTGNAVKFTDDGFVRLSCYTAREPDPRKDVTLFFEVEDTGIGIPEEEQELIFESFRQQDGQSTRKYGGTGLGLSISRRLVHMMGGHIHLDSTVGAGSRFTVWLPHVPVSLVPAAGTGTAPQEKIFFSNATILVTDDDAGSREIIQEMLEQAGATVISAASGREALFSLQQLKPDLVLLDIMMPDMDGQQVLRIIRNLYDARTLPVIAVTASGKVGSDAGAHRLGFDGWLPKPLVSDDVYRVLMRWLPFERIVQGGEDVPVMHWLREMSQESRDRLCLQMQPHLAALRFVMRKDAAEQLLDILQGAEYSGNPGMQAWAARMAKAMHNFDIVTFRKMADDLRGLCHGGKEGSGG